MDRQAELADIIEVGDRKEHAGIWDPEHAEFLLGGVRST